MRVEGSRDGLTRSQAEAKLRRLIAETKPARMTAGDALTMAELAPLPREPGVRHSEVPSLDASVPMADEVAGKLDRLSRAAGESSGEALVFADPHTAGPLDKAAILRRFRRALKAARLEQSHRFHDLRHTFCTAMACTGVPRRTLQE